VHLIQLVERREAKLTQREQRDMVRGLVREKKMEEAYLTTWMQELRGPRLRRIPRSTAVKMAG
jgi:peptidyl-prolyl cis-trans isomerase SurA